MGLQPDQWIRKMALEHGMIEPFVDHQVREGVISFGVSSYGYDVRVADEFKIFTNIFSAVVDPKHFDPRSMVDFKGDVCVIPPNSFVLAKTVEYFRIPRKVLTVCLGKSTYARCFSADTRVALADGSAPTFEDMARRAENGETFRGYGLDAANHVIETELTAPRFIGRDALLEIELDNGQKFRCTPDHRIYTRDGRTVEAHELRPGASLMPLYRAARMLYQPAERSFYPADHTASSHPQPASTHNHKVTAIRALPGDHDTYCLTVPETGNFALAAGVFVKNCGLIVNVTPFEPEWEGFVTLEISNTTPLPARVYANEGIAQVLFFEADEECQISYADKKGKYQYQQSIDLPKI